MQIQEKTGISGGRFAGTSAVKTTSEKYANITAVKTQPQAAPQVPNIPRSIASLISSLNLPKDKLSANLLSFARFFSVPMKPELMAEIRRQAFSPQATVQNIAVQKMAEKLQDASLIDKTRSTLLLAATAAESKGVELSSKGLEYFAEAIDPEWEERQKDGQSKDKQNKDQDKQEENEKINGAVLQRKAGEVEENSPLLSIMNKLLNKDGKRWIVNSFEFNQGGRDFRVSMRVLMDGDNAVFTALDITEPYNDNRYSFSLEFTNNKVSKLCMYLKDQKDKFSGLQNKHIKELAALFEIPAENVFIKNGYENFVEAEYGESHFSFIDEAV